MKIRINKVKMIKKKNNSLNKKKIISLMNL